MTSPASRGQASPYGVYDLAENAGWVNVGTDHDTAVFAVESSAAGGTAWACTLPAGDARLLITADGGGQQWLARVRGLWKAEIATGWPLETGLPIPVCHFPPGTTKWNKIEHRLFAHITQNWRGSPS